jgi:hypothetical protein
MCVLVVFAIMYLTDSAVSYDMRHFGALAFLFLPFCIHEISKVKGAKWLVLGLVFIAILDLGYLGYKVIQHHNQYVMHEGMRISLVDAEVVKEVKKLGLNEKDLIVVEEYWGLVPYFSSPKICIKQKDGEWKVNSGMELVKGDQPYDFNEGNYNRIIVLSNKKQSNWLPKNTYLKHQYDLDVWRISVFYNGYEQNVIGE